jgi:HEPN domain-containing protein
MEKSTLSKLIETRLEFQELAGHRLDEAKALLDAEKWDGAYYLAGYAVELALKSCIIKRLMATDAFPDRKFSEHCYTHSIEKLVVLANLEVLKRLDSASNLALEDNWQILKLWSEEKRYHRIEQKEAETLYSAIADNTHGVFTWIKRHW